MKKKLLLATLMTFLLVPLVIAGQIKIDLDRANKIRLEKIEEDSIGWQRGLGIGLDFFQLIQINPRVGAGEDRVQFGGLSTFFFNYNNQRLSWDNNGTLLFGVQRLGSGTTMFNGTSVSKPFQKTVDELRAVSSLSYKVAEGSPWKYSADLIAFTQLTPTYSGNFLSDVTESGAAPRAKFLSPLQASFSPGIRYEPSDKFAVIASPASTKLIYVADDEIASIPGNAEEQVGLHGTKWRGENDFENAFVQFGASLRALYNNKYLSDRFVHKSELILFSNYLRDPQNIDLDWRNEFAFQIYKGLKLTLIVNLFYDHDIPVQKTDPDQPNGIAQNPDGSVRLTRALNVVQTFAISYNYVF